MESKKKKISAKLLVPWLLFLASLGANAYFSYTLYFVSKSHVPLSPQQQIAETVEAVGKLIVLPSNETPTVATVTDPSQLGSLSQIAKVGDILLIYTGIQKAILYDPVGKKIIDVVPVDANNDSNSTSSSE